MSSRLERLRTELQGRELESMMVSAPENRRYLSGFTGSAGYLIVSQDDAVLATDFRYVEQAGNQAPDFRIERITGGLAWFPKLLAEMGIKRLGFESENVTVATFSAFEKAFKEASKGAAPELVSTAGIVEKLRAVKDAGELELLARAVDIADRAFEAVAPSVTAGVTEEEVAWNLEKAMRELGAEAIAFDIIVGAGPNGALPHHRAGDKVIRDGEAVVIDMGASYQGYCSDLSRTLIVGEPDEIFSKVYDTVLRAQLAAEEQVVAGMKGREIDAISRDIIAEAGYGDNFGHSLGHGVGLAVHESPGVGPTSEGPVENGMVFTIEPGIYLSGWGGVRIEDMAVMENGRARILSSAHKRVRAT
jgi:Xaa-Pro aminopeptidase